MKIIEKYANIPQSETLKINTRANELRDEGKNVINFSAGESDFNTPEVICKAAIDAINTGKTRYTPATGIIPLRQSIARKLKRENGLEYDINQVIVSSGAKHSIFNIIQVLCGPGDEVIIPVPYWVSYPALVNSAGATPVYLETKMEDNFQIDPEALEKIITPKTRVLFLNSPSNPTGSVYTKEILEKISEIVVKHDIVCLSDEIYEKLVFDGAEHVSIASFNDEIYNRTIVVNGVSKSHAMTGWRIGYAAGPLEVMKTIARMQGHSASNPCTISQHAALAALEAPENVVGDMVKVFETRKNLALKLLQDIPGVKLAAPQGAFYLFPDVSSYFGKEIRGRKINNANELVEVILEESLVATVSGTAFGAQNHIRISYPSSQADIETGIKRIGELLT